MKHVSPDCESDMWYESRDDYGWRVPDELWERYEAAEAELLSLGAEINKCPVDARPPPRPGTLARRLYDGYQAQFLASLEHSAPIFRRRSLATPEPEETTE